MFSSMKNRHRTRLALDLMHLLSCYLAGDLLQKDKN